MAVREVSGARVQAATGVGRDADPRWHLVGMRAHGWCDPPSDFRALLLTAAELHPGLIRAEQSDKQSLHLM